MALRHSTGLANFALTNAQSIATAFDNATAGWLNIYSGAAPASADNAVTGTLLAELRLNTDAFAAVAGGARGIALNSVTSDTSANASNPVANQACYFRMIADGDAGGASTTLRRLQGVVDVSGNSPDMAIDNVNIVAGGTVALSAWTYTHPL